MKKLFLLILLISYLKQEGLAQNSLYLLPQINMPLPSNKFQFIAEAYTGINASGANLCFSVSDHVLCIVTGCGQLTGQYNEENPHLNSSLSAFQTDIGGGYYKKFSTTGVFELIAGAGFGNSKYSYEYYDGDFYVNSINYEMINAAGHINHFFIQGDLGFSTSNASIGFGLRFNDIYGNSTYASIDDYTPPDLSSDYSKINISCQYRWQCTFLRSLFARLLRNKESEN